MTLSDRTRVLGAAPTGARLARIQASPHWRDGRFRNPVPTRKTLPGTMLETIRRQLGGPEQRVPPGPLPVVDRVKETLAVLPRSGLRATWLGHSTMVLELDGHRLLVDPVWAERVSPWQRVGPKRFHRPPVAIGGLPPLDVVLITHDHYDHLDMAAVQALAANRAQAKARLAASACTASMSRWS